MKSEKDKVFASVKQSIREMKAIDSGRKKGKPAMEVLEELVKERDNRGGARAGAGKKSPLQEKYPTETKKQVTLRVYPTQLKQIERKFGSLQAAVDSLVK